MSEKQIDERRLHLEEYLQQIVAQLNWSLDDSLRSFLECDEWLKPRKSPRPRRRRRRWGRRRWLALPLGPSARSKLVFVLRLH
eukprot:scaffold23228_cov57-Phaeocystis_antarctica.AAC.2